ncbi:hypothetical protein AAAW54_004185 [Cronobacter sakazakii]
MKERGMIFNSEMVRALLDGTKTQTRRIMKVQPDSPDFGLLRIVESTARSNVGKYHWSESNACGNHIRSKLFTCPFGAIGDRLWVREAWAEAGGNAPELQLYRANYPDHVSSHYEHLKPAEEIRWRPNIHMPRWASRITLEITDVRVERLRHISDADAKAEGYPAERGKAGSKDDAWLWYCDLWKSLYGQDSWLESPWVWVIEFKLVNEEQPS